MKAVIAPQKKQYRILFYDDRRVRVTGYIEIKKTIKGYRPEEFRYQTRRVKNYKHAPTKELVMHLRRSEVSLTTADEPLESFLHDLQIPFSYITICRFCLMDDQVTELSSDTAVTCGKNKEKICISCAKKEIRREMAHMGRIGRGALTHLDELLLQYRDVDRVLASCEPDSAKQAGTLYDRIEAHPVIATTPLCELPLPYEFVAASGVQSLMPVQQLAYEGGLLYGKDLLIVSATASGKTFIGEMAGLKNYLEGRGQVLFLVPLVALANQKYDRFFQRYGKIVEVSQIIGRSRIITGSRPLQVNKNRNAGIIVATYEGIDNLLRRGEKLPLVSTVIIDEVQMLEDPERGHRVDGLISRLKYLAPKAQYLYLSATIGLPNLLARKLQCQLVTYSERPVPLERYLLFLQRQQKIPVIKRYIEEEYNQVSSRGYHGQSIVFTNSRARCHIIADKVGDRVAAYHGGLTHDERRIIEDMFSRGELRAVITTAALAAGVDFPASAVIFDSLAMGISWLTVQEFCQMSGRAGRPDYHDLGKVVILAEPGGSYSRESRMTEEEVAIGILKGVMNEVAPVYDLEQSSELFAANAVVCDGFLPDLTKIEDTLVGTAEPVSDLLFANCLIQKQKDRILMTEMAKIMAHHFIGIERLQEIRRLIREIDDPLDIVARLDCTVSSGQMERESDKLQGEKKGKNPSKQHDNIKKRDRTRR
ncbi:MAG: DEAD/DEAH box helicase [Methanospirillaceae archaeon]|nr:DEAD/DEAH box helicase [Methanospirillaceae archaeon]